MSPEEQNKAICEWMGKSYHKPTPEEIKSGSYYQYEPNFTGDLNVMHEAESMLKEFSVQEYPEILKSICDRHWHATAAQRAEAMLRTIGKWKDGGK